ncbi:hypothetical protein AAVH_02879 [Aphelenchoides avenae]|nr:hypothetical protein AAVH_02879 [Aphelenchus avenae]
MLPLSSLFVSLITFIELCLACIGGGGGGNQCCPTRAQPSCGASAPSCGASYGGGAYAAPQNAAYEGGSSYIAPPPSLPLPPPSSCCGASDAMLNLPPIVQPPLLGHNPGAGLPPAPAPPAPSYVQQQVLPALARPPGSSESSDDFHANYAQPQPFPREYQVDHGADQLFPPMAYQEGSSVNNQPPAALHMPHSAQPPHTEDKLPPLNTIRCMYRPHSPRSPPGMKLISSHAPHFQHTTYRHNARNLTQT